MFEKASVTFKSIENALPTKTWEALAEPKPYAFREVPNGFCVSNGVDHHYATTAMEVYDDMYDQGLYDELRLTSAIVISAPFTKDISWLVPVIPSTLPVEAVRSRIERLEGVLKKFGCQTKLTNMYEVLSRVRG